MRLVVLAVGILAAAACGGEDAVEEPARPATELRVTLWPDGRGGEALRATLTCDPAGGDHPRPDPACRALRDHAGALEPVAADAICTQIYGGPEEAEVEGTLEGRRVQGVFDRRNGCEIARWKQLEPVLALRR